MKHFIIALLLILVISQVRSPDVPPVAAPAPPPPPPAPEQTGPTSNTKIDTSSTDKVTASGASTPAPPPVTTEAFIVQTKSKGYTNANNAWNYLQSLGGGCCNNCNRICGMAIKLYGTNYYLTYVAPWYRFINTPTSNPSSLQIFTLGQNADCTWSLSNSGRYLSGAGVWVTGSTTLGINERWYIQRSGAFVYVQSASFQYNYWITSIGPWYYLGRWNTGARRLTFEYYPCDKKFGWNW